MAILAGLVLCLLTSYTEGRYPAELAIYWPEGPSGEPKLDSHPGAMLTSHKQNTHTRTHTHLQVCRRP